MCSSRHILIVCSHTSVHVVYACMYLVLTSIAYAQVSPLLPFAEREAHAMACSGGARLVVTGGDNPDKGKLDDIQMSPCASEATCRT
jgi:hypothetical protein